MASFQITIEGQNFRYLKEGKIFAGASVSALLQEFINALDAGGHSQLSAMLEFDGMVTILTPMRPYGLVKECPKA